MDKTDERDALLRAPLLHALDAALLVSGAGIIAVLGLIGVDGLTGDTVTSVMPGLEKLFACVMTALTGRVFVAILPGVVGTAAGFLFMAAIIWALPWSADSIAAGIEKVGAQRQLAATKDVAQEMREILEQTRETGRAIELLSDRVDALSARVLSEKDAVGDPAEPPAPK